MTPGSHSRAGPSPLATRSLPLLVSLGSRLVKASPVYLASAAAEIQNSLEKEEGPDDLTREEYIFKLIVSVALVVIGGIFAGLTLGLMGLDPLHLRVLKTSSDDERERHHATKVLRLLNRGRHWVLVVLLLGNVIVNESLPIFLDSILGGGIAAVVASTVLIVIFGEIIPQSVGVRYGLAIGSFSAPFVLTLMFLTSPISYPIAKLLDWVLGANEDHTYKKAELKAFLQFHKEGEEPLRDDEITILNGVLSLNSTKAGDIMTPISDVMCLSSDAILDHEKIDFILLSGFSRIPVHQPGRPTAFIGMLLVKKLLLYNPEDPLPVSAFPLVALPEAKPNINCFQALDFFQVGKSHLLMLSDTPGKDSGALGVISLEDIIEEIIGEEINDETDRYVDNRSKKRARRQSSADVMRGIIERERTKLRRMDTINSVPGSPGLSDRASLRSLRNEYTPTSMSRRESESLLSKVDEATRTTNGSYGAVLSSSPSEQK